RGSLAVPTEILVRGYVPAQMAPLSRLTILPENREWLLGQIRGFLKIYDQELLAVLAHPPADPMQIYQAHLGDQTLKVFDSGRETPLEIPQDRVGIGLVFLPAWNPPSGEIVPEHMTRRQWGTMVAALGSAVTTLFGAETASEIAAFANRLLSADSETVQ